jgi:hypothetical protein
MLTKHVRPSSLEGIKSLASEIKKGQAQPHNVALNAAAKQAGYSNYPHALRELKKSARQSSIFLTVYWLDPKSFDRGRETLRVSLPTNLNRILQRKQFRLLRGLGLFRQVNDDHFVVDRLLESQRQARSLACEAARTCQFLSYSGLRPPSRDHKIDAFLQLKRTFPDLDHATDWFDPITGTLLFTNEPYEDRFESLSEERLDWCERSGWQVAQVDWAGMYFPNQCNLMLVAPGEVGIRLQELANKIAQAPDPYDEDAWVGESVDSLDTYLSPGTAPSPNSRRRSKAKGMIDRVPSRSTTPYGPRSFGRRRPNGHLPLSAHVELGGRLKAIIASSPPVWFSRDKPGLVRSELENWMFAEHRAKDVDKVGGLRVYYGAVPPDQVYLADLKSDSDKLAYLARVSAILIDGYPDCAPLRLMLRRIESASASLRNSIGVL